MSRKKKPRQTGVSGDHTDHAIWYQYVGTDLPMSAAGIWLDKHFRNGLLDDPAFSVWELWPEGQNVYRMARTIYEDGDDKHTKKINRTVLEMDLGILFLGVSAQIIGAFIAKG